MEFSRQKHQLQEGYHYPRLWRVGWGWQLLRRLEEGRDPLKLSPWASVSLKPHCCPFPREAKGLRARGSPRDTSTRAEGKARQVVLLSDREER